MSTQTIVFIVSLAISIGAMIAICITSYHRGYNDCMNDIDMYINDILEDDIKWKK